MLRLFYGCGTPGKQSSAPARLHSPLSLGERLTSVSVTKDLQKQNKSPFLPLFLLHIKGRSPKVMILTLNRVAASDLMAQREINICLHQKSMEHKLGKEYFLTLAPSSGWLGASHTFGQ